MKKIISALLICMLAAVCLFTGCSKAKGLKVKDSSGNDRVLVTDENGKPGKARPKPALSEYACPACGNTVYVSEDDLDAGEAICPSCNVAFEVALADEDDDEAPEEPDDGPARYEVTCPACGATSVVDEEALLDGEPVCPACGKPLDFEVTEE